MWKQILAVLAMLYAAASFAAVDVNKATAAELDSVKGIGPAISGKIIEERKKGSFKDWQDFIDRVKGVGEGNAARFSAEGLTVNGAAYRAAVATRKDDKKEAKAAAKEEKAAAKETKADSKAAAKEEKASAKGDKKAAKAAAKEDKKDAKAQKTAASGKPAASAAKK